MTKRLELDLDVPQLACFHLSERERACLTAQLLGSSYKEIARELGISPSTVSTYLKRAYQKVGSKQREYFLVLLQSENGKKLR